MKTLAILTNGGDTCTLNASIRSIRDNAYKAGYKKIYGIRRGYQGLVDGWIDDITDTQIDPRIGGSCLGSLRVSPTDKKEKKKEGGNNKVEIPPEETKENSAGEGEEPEDDYPLNKRRCEKMAKCLSDFRIDVLVVIGGDGTLQATKKFQGWVHQQRATKRFRPFDIIGFLKTIDNDIRTFTNFEGIEVSLCPGFPSAVKKIVLCVEDLRVTTRTAERAFSVETMGRDAGWLAAAATFGGAEILLVPEHLKIYQEVVFKEGSTHTKDVSNKIISDLVDEIAHFYEKNRNVLIAVAEGFEPQVEIKELNTFTEVIRNLYGKRKKVGATELIATLVRPVLEYYFWCLSNICRRKHGAGDLSQLIREVIALANSEPVGKEYMKRVKDNVPRHPLSDWAVEKRLREVLRATKIEESNTQSSGENSKLLQPGHSPFDELAETTAEQEDQRTLLAIPPYKFEIRPHRTDYLPRSGPPSSYDYRFATVLGRRIGHMLLPENREFGAVPVLEQVVPYDELTLDAIKTVRIDEIRTLNFQSLDYFNHPNSWLQVSERITDFFRTIMSGPEDLEKAIQDTSTLE
jgi:6-phosphofructokinase